MDIVVNYTVTISDDATVQQALKDLLDQVLDKANAGGNYVARFRAVLKVHGTDGLRRHLHGFRSNQTVTTMRQAQTAIKATVDIGEPV